MYNCHHFFIDKKNVNGQLLYLNTVTLQFCLWFYHSNNTPLKLWSALILPSYTPQRIRLLMHEYLFAQIIYYRLSSNNIETLEYLLSHNAYNLYNQHNALQTKVTYVYILCDTLSFFHSKEGHDSDHPWCHLWHLGYLQYRTGLLHVCIIASIIHHRWQTTDPAFPTQREIYVQLRDTS